MKLGSSDRRSGFTLVEVLIVVVLMAVLAAAVIPHVAGAIEDARQSTLQDDERELNLAIQRYRAEHAGNLPTGIRRLFTKTDASGAVTGDGKFGPYLLAVPVNPLNDSSAVVRVSDLASVDLHNYAGWVWDNSSGQFAGGLSPVPTASGGGTLELADGAALTAAEAVAEAELEGN